ncbi:MAG TPA: hypothetical protein VEO56_16905 [Bacteroidota bacterium]|nr:hypothetical protein [Bacteroidota bacterium]
MKRNISWVSIVPALLITLFWLVAMSQSKSYTPFEVGKKYTLSTSNPNLPVEIDVIEIYPNGWIRISASSS